jgi:hypothetical protein
MHIGIFGPTQCGKTTISLYLIKYVYKPAGRICLVLDDICDPAFTRAGADFQTDDPEHFLKVVKANPDASIFVDESGDLVGRKEIEQLATKHRHAGQNVHYMGQRPCDTRPRIRANLPCIYLFRSDIDDCKILAKEKVQPAFMEGVNLERGEFIFSGTFTKTRRGNVSKYFGKF